MKSLVVISLCLFFLACGDDGQQGPKGDDGDTGTACNVIVVLPGDVAPTGGALITCGSSSALVFNGVAGQDAPASPLQITALIDPCGQTAGYYNEVLLKTASGQIIASFSDNVSGYNTHLAILPPGNYLTTDGTNCNFSVNVDGSVSW